MNERSSVGPIRRFVGSAIVIFGIAWGGTANAQVFRCTDADGHTVFSDTQCGTNSQKVDVVESSGGLSPIGSDGLSAEERGQLGAAEARAAQIANERAPGGANQSAGAPSSSPPSPPALHSGY
jgi:hypothetical protein